MKTLIMITDPICCFSLSFKSKINYLPQQRGFHTLPVPIKIYSNADVEKPQIVGENRNKAGVYR